MVIAAVMARRLEHPRWAELGNVPGRGSVPARHEPDVTAAVPNPARL